MNFEDYDYVFDYPIKSAFSRTVEVESPYGGEKKLVKFFDEDGYKMAVAKYHAKVKRIEEKFKEDLFEELGIQNNPKKEMLYQVAYNRGISSGFPEVYDCALSLVELIQ